MKEELISFETAKLVKEKGFDVPVRYGVYGIKMKLTEDHGNGRNPQQRDVNWNAKTKQQKHSQATSIPTQSLLQKWLRDVYDIKLCISYTCIDDSEYAYIWDITIPTEKGRKKDSWDFNEKMDSFSRLSWWDTYEEALEEGLKEALKLIK